MAAQLNTLLAEFYIDHHPDADAILITEQITAGVTRLQNNSPFKSHELTPEERRNLAERLSIYQKEMRDFSDFIYRKHLSA